MENIKRTLALNGITIDKLEDWVEEDDNSDYEIGNYMSEIYGELLGCVCREFHRYEKNAGLNFNNTTVDDLELSSEQKKLWIDYNILATAGNHSSPLIYPAQLIIGLHNNVSANKIALTALMEIRRSVCDILSMPMDIYEQIDEYFYKQCFFDRLGEFV